MSSRALGFKDYNTLRSENREIIVFHDKEEKKNFLNPISITEIEDKYIKELNEKYPPIKREMVYLNKVNDNINVFIDKELSNETYTYYLLFSAADNLTKRVFYSPKYNTISFYIYPNVKEGLSDYYIELEITDNKLVNKSRIIEILKHLNGKNWFNNEFLEDYLNICSMIENDIPKLKKFIESTSQKSLEILYNLKNRDNQFIDLEPYFVNPSLSTKDIEKR